MLKNETLLASRWIDGTSARRPMRPSETRTSGTATRRRLPAGRAEFDEPLRCFRRSTRTGSDWRGRQGLTSHDLSAPQRSAIRSRVGRPDRDTVSVADDRHPGLGIGGCPSSSDQPSIRRPPSSRITWSARARTRGRWLAATTVRLPSVAAKQAVPEAGLGLDVERARQVVDHEQFGAPDERPGGRGALHLATGQPDARGSDPGAAAVGHLGEVLVEAGQGQRPVEAGVGQAERDRVDQRLGEQAGHLGTYAARARHEPRRRFVDGGATFQRIVPPLGRNEPEQRSEQRATLPEPTGPVITTSSPRPMARSTPRTWCPTSNRTSRPSTARWSRRSWPRRARGAASSMGANGGGPCRWWVSGRADARSGSSPVASRPSRAAEISAWRCQAEPPHRDAGQRGDNTRVGHEQADVADVEVAPAHRRAVNRRARPMPAFAVRGRRAPGTAACRPRRVGPRRRAGHRARRTGEGRRPRRRTPDRADPAEHVADEPGDPSGGGALGDPPAAEPVAEQVGDPETTTTGRTTAGPAKGAIAKRTPSPMVAPIAAAVEVEPHVEHLGRVAGVVAEAAHRLAG